MTPADIRRLRARLGTPPPSQGRLGELLAVDATVVHRLERGHRSARGLVREVLLALQLVIARGGDPGDALDRGRSRGERLAALFRRAYGGAE